MEQILKILMIFIGTYMTFSGLIKSAAYPYRLLVKRAEMLWGKRTHLFLVISGAIVTLLGILWFLNIIW